MLTLEQVAWVLQKPARTVRKMARERVIGSNKMGGDLRFLIEDVWAYIRKTRQVAMPTQAASRAGEDLEWGRIERLIAVAVESRVPGPKADVQSPERERLAVAA
jgi:excisionase family DNA binding protein